MCDLFWGQNLYQVLFSEYGGGITLDGWKEVRSQTDYIGLTVHYYLDWKLHERSLLMTEYDREIKTGENIREFVEANLKNPYGVTETLFHNALFVTDGASTSKHGESFRQLSKASEAALDRFTCACHRINTSLSDIFLEKFVRLHHGEDAVTRLKPAYQLVKDCKELVVTRWGSHVAMLESVQDQFTAVEAILKRRNEEDKLPGPDGMLNDLIVLLKPFETATEELSASRTPTLHLVVNVFKAVREHLEEYQSEYPSLIKLGELLLVNFKQKCIVQPEHKIACFLHPPFRKLRIFSTDAERTGILNLTRSLLPSRAKPAAETTTAPVTVPAKRKKFNYSQNEDVVDTESVADEVTRYHELVCRIPVGDAAELWKENEKQFPGLAKLAKKYLATPAGSVASEHKFNRGPRRCGFVDFSRCGAVAVNWLPVRFAE
ncbi:hypothetical protein BV898_19330 [Hypsibius exemplaris]|uniref:HAT C-terminal dimerisation domain-containing protein n=1 Tax=Hypsibius exemplaris TaxID=2072580 RepID=A0A9X6NL97_HYPEX|nr:hypothetical protein BV898_19330 [Hypsibius exemplaris]